jgi:hypothetical protein
MLHILNGKYFDVHFKTAGIVPSVRQMAVEKTLGSVLGRGRKLCFYHHI